MPLDFPGQIPTSPISFAFTRGRVFGAPLLSETRAPGGLWEREVPTSGGSPLYFFLPATSPVYGETSSHLSLSRTQASESGPCSDCQDLGRSSSETLGILDRCLGALPPAPSVCGGSGLPPLKTQQPNPLHTCPHVIWRPEPPNLAGRPEPFAALFPGIVLSCCLSKTGLRHKYQQLWTNRDKHMNRQHDIISHTRTNIYLYTNLSLYLTWSNQIVFHQI